VKYYVKNVPAQYQKAFAGAFNEWNSRLQPVLGKKMFNVEFLSPKDPRNALIVAGDVRYNVLEWDLVNKAPYGGLGPSIAHQFTGELFTANVLVQGPTIITLYTEWFKTAKKIQHLLAQGHVTAAKALEAEAARVFEERAAAKSQAKLALKLGQGALAFVVRSQQSALEDPLTQRPDFDNLPVGYTFQTYMNGYFHDLVAHELGHNIGLRHNFRGNLGAAEELAIGKVSRSIMEYLGRGFRHLDLIGEYDVMAVAYGYKGIAPKETNWFCTDEQKADLTDPSTSAECTTDDATNDPFGFFQARLDKSLGLLVNKGSSAAPDWTVQNMARELTAAFTGIGTYATSAEQTSATWTNFAGPGRPTSATAIRPWVLAQLKGALCSPALAQEAAAKATAAAKAATEANIAAVRAEAARLLVPAAFSAAELSCN
jgi:hypothetical protein